jgi:signal peptidase I
VSAAVGDVETAPLPVGPASARWRASEPLAALLVALLVAVFARCFLVQAFRIPTASMEPNLQVGDHVLVNKFVFGRTRYPWERRWLPLREPRRGDVAVFRFPGEPRRDMVKRVVGLPGTRVALHRKQLSVDGTEVVEAAYVHHADRRAYPDSPLLDTFYRRRDNLTPLTVPSEAYFVLGDNRDMSEDSRFWGTVPRSHLRGRALLVYWSTAAPAAETAAEELATRVPARRRPRLVR